MEKQSQTDQLPKRRVKQNDIQGEKAKAFAKSVGTEQQPDPEDSIVSVALAWWLEEEPER